MLKEVWCDCGYETSFEVSDHRGYRWDCPRCRTGHVALGVSSEGNKSLDVFRTAVRRLVQRDAEGAAQGFAQFRELWLKGIIRERDPEWLVKNPRAKYPQLVACVKALYGLPHFSDIDKSFRNDLEHDLSRITNTVEATGFGDHVLETMWTNLMELIGEDTWARGEAGELDTWSSTESEERFQEFWRYHHHYRSGAVGAVMWARTFWFAYRSGRTDWHRAEWVARRGRLKAGVGGLT